MDIKKRMQELDEQIQSLQLEKEALVEKYVELDEVPFLDKFKTWYFNNSMENCHYSSIPTKDKFPKLRAMISNGDYQRHQTFTLEEFLGEDLFYYLYDGHEKIDDQKPELIKYWQKEVEEAMPIMKECMNNNIKSFTIDW